jgi:two-component system LytT family sensor kinase
MTPETPEQLLAALSAKVAIATAIASILIRSARFRQIVFAARRTVREQIMLGLYIGLPVAFGVMMRTQFDVSLPDLSVEGALLAGTLGGGVAGVTAGIVAALSAQFARTLGGWETLTLPVMIVVGLIGKGAGALAPDVEHIWHFSPFIDMNIYRWVRRRFGKPRGEWQLFFFLMICAVEALVMLLAHSFPGQLFALHSHSKALLVLIVAGGVGTVAVPIRIWNSIRNELKIEEQNRLLMEARLEALTRQINPHFLFNTLNSISSLVRTDPELARVLIQKLSNIMRRLLRRSEALTSLREELDFVDDYLSIERVRFGEKLQVIREVDDAALDTPVPSMLLQPLVENSIKHGIQPKVEGGTIRIRGSHADGRLRLEISDDGQGIPEEKIGWIYDEGVGLNNVKERVKMLYGEDFHFRVTSKYGQGTRVEIELPDLPVK